MDYGRGLSPTKAEPKGPIITCCGQCQTTCELTNLSWQLLQVSGKLYESRETCKMAYGPYMYLHLNHTWVTKLQYSFDADMLA